MRPMKTASRDPAPSRLAYRMQRLALTPMVRRGFTIGLPVFTVVLISGLALADQSRRAAFAERIEEVTSQFRNRKEFQVQTMSIAGASEELEQDIHEILPIDFPVSSFDLDLQSMQAGLGALDAVERADLRVRPGGMLEINVAERMPAVIWRTGTGLLLLDATGHRTAPLPRRGLRPDLPIISGTGADAAAAEALELIEKAAPLVDRVRGLARIGERRWDVVLSGGQRIMLPEVDAAAALEEVIALHEAEELFAREVRAVDMRNPERPTVRMTPAAAQSMRQIKLIELGDDGL